MRIAILQLAPRLGEPERNRAHADTLLADAGLGEDVHGELDRENDSDVGLDLLALPEMAFSGYNFSSLTAIQPFLEPTATGPSAQWAARTARRLRCCVAVGYPETTSTPAHVPSSVEEAPPTRAPSTPDRIPQNFNALVVVGPDGAVHAHYRKTHLYYTDATWAAPSLTGWQVSSLPVPHPINLSPSASSTTTAANSTRTAFAICMDLNPEYFTAPWAAYEAASFVRQSQAPLLLASMAWLTSDRPPVPSEEYTVPDDGPDWPTLTYWLDRLSPLLWQGTDDGTEADTHPLQAAPSSTPETIVIVANRTGTEPGPCRACELDPAVRAATKADAASQRAVAQATVNEAAAAAHPGAEPVAVLPSAPMTNGSGPSEANPIDENSCEPVARTAMDASGTERGPIVSLEARYAGSSCVLGLGGGLARVWGVLGKAEEGVLRVNTAQEPGRTWRLTRQGEDKEGSGGDEGTEESEGSSGDESANGEGGKC